MKERGWFEVSVNKWYDKENYRYNIGNIRNVGWQIGFLTSQDAILFLIGGDG